MKVLVLIALFGVAAAAVTRAINEELNEDWQAYTTKHGMSGIVHIAGENLLLMTFLFSH
jgi:hypothetical protein